jgi:toxin ParE1/3/4
MSEPRITQQAEADLEEAWVYIARRNETAGDRLLDQILDRCRLHAQFPKMGAPRDEVAPRLRSFVVAPYVVFYRPALDTIEVLRVLHRARDIDSIMKGDAD